MTIETMWEAIARREKERDLLLEELKSLIEIDTKILSIEKINQRLNSAIKLIQ